MYNIKGLIQKLIISIIFMVLMSSLISSVSAQPQIIQQVDSARFIKTGAEQMHLYLDKLKGKKIGLLANNTSRIKGTHLVDSLLSLGISVKKVFCPEHGFRGDADAGEKVKSYKDKKTGLPIISMYGDHKKPKPADLKGLDLVIFDIQDVGARFYTYISSMHYMMEACAENKIPFLVLDRPNPNGTYVDGPVLEKSQTSFVGLHPVPIVHGMTVGEYAIMINQEGWLVNGVKCSLEVIKCEKYNHNFQYQLPIKPSPNLPNMAAIYLYPSLCLFEGTNVSVGRGTEKPFQLIGLPGLNNSNAVYSFTPKSIPGASKYPPYEGVECKGYDLSKFGEIYMKNNRSIYLFWLINMYKDTPDKEHFFNDYFNHLSGNSNLKEQIIKGTSEEEIRKSWQPALDNFKSIRKKYLLYRDFED